MMDINRLKELKYFRSHLQGIFFSISNIILCLLVKKLA